MFLLLNYGVHSDTSDASVHSDASDASDTSERYYCQDNYVIVIDWLTSNYGL